MRNYSPQSIVAVSDRSLPTVQVNTILPREAFNKLEAIARARKLTKSALVRELIMKYVDNANQQE